MPPSFEQKTATQDVTSQSEIRGMLRRILKHHTLVTVRLPAPGGEYCSALVDVVGDEGYWLLDELPESASQHKVAPGHVLRIRGRLDGVEFRFKSRVEATGESDGAGFYKMRIPERLRYEQKRSNYRAPVSAGQSITVELHTSGGEVLKGELRNISNGGFRVALKASGQTVPSRGDVLPKCAIIIATRDEICCEAEVRYVRPQKSTRSWSLGARFVGLEPAQHRRVCELVAELQRHCARLMARA
jgi:c-di-GMP-binding flagellar brake protein YcgR